MAIVLSTHTQTTFDGEITVGSRIIDNLSSGLYTSPGACLKELVNNSYDAEATRVEIFVKPDADRIIVSDNGTGMSRTEFERHFRRVSESHKRDVNDKTSNGRPKIGKIGIGFIAANELCEVMEIYSTKSGSNELLHVAIDFGEMRKPLEERRRGEDKTVLVKADYHGEILYVGEEEHYTQIFLTSVRGPARDILAGASSQDSQETARSLYGLKSTSILSILKDPKLDSWKEFDAYSETMLEVALNVPVEYYPGWIPSKIHGHVEDLETEVKKLDFKVFYDGSQLYKPTVLAPPDELMLLDRFDFEGDHVSAKGYFYAQHGTMRPRDIQGLLLRVRNAAVGEYDHSFLEFSPSDSGLIQRWISAEVWADDRLEEAMNIDRKQLRTTHPAYVELRRAIHAHLRTVLNRTTSELYRKPSNERKQKRTNETMDAVRAMARERIAPFAPVVARELTNMVDQASTKSSVRKNLEQRYTVTELFETIIKASEDILSPEQLEKLLKRLTERLGS